MSRGWPGPTRARSQRRIEPRGRSGPAAWEGGALRRAHSAGRNTDVDACAGSRPSDFRASRSSRQRAGLSAVSRSVARGARVRRNGRQSRRPCSPRPRRDTKVPWLACIHLEAGGTIVASDEHQALARLGAVSMILVVGAWPAPCRGSVASPTTTCGERQFHPRYDPRTRLDPWQGAATARCSARLPLCRRAEGCRFNTRREPRDG